MQDSAGPKEVLDHLERSATEYSRNLSTLLETLHNGLHDISSNSVQHLQVHKMATDNLAEQVDQTVLAMHTLVTKCIHLNKELKKVEELHKEIKELRRAVDTCSIALNKAAEIKPQNS